MRTTTSFVPAAQATPPLAAGAPSIGPLADTRAIARPGRDASQLGEIRLGRAAAAAPAASGTQA